MQPLVIGSILGQQQYVTGWTAELTFDKPAHGEGSMPALGIHNLPIFRIFIGHPQIESLNCFQPNTSLFPDPVKHIIHAECPESAARKNQN